MTRFIELTEVGTQQCATVNADAIATIAEIPQGSRVIFLNGTWLNVTQTVGQVMARLADADPL